MHFLLLVFIALPAFAHNAYFYDPACQCRRFQTPKVKVFDEDFFEDNGRQVPRVSVSPVSGKVRYINEDYVPTTPKPPRKNASQK